jgi:hypothetical protein
MKIEKKRATLTAEQKEFIKDSAARGITMTFANVRDFDWADGFYLYPALCIGRKAGRLPPGWQTHLTCPNPCLTLKLPTQNSEGAKNNSSPALIPSRSRAWKVRSADVE